MTGDAEHFPMALGTILWLSFEGCLFNFFFLFNWVIYLFAIELSMCFGCCLLEDLKQTCSPLWRLPSLCGLFYSEQKILVRWDLTPVVSLVLSVSFLPYSQNPPWDQRWEALSLGIVPLFTFFFCFSVFSTFWYMMFQNTCIIKILNQSEFLLLRWRPLNMAEISSRLVC